MQLSIRAIKSCRQLAVHSQHSHCRPLQVRRRSLGISQRELCDNLGIYRDDLDAYEHGAKRVSANLLLRIAKLLDVQPDYFFQDYTAEELSACLEPSL